MFEGWFDFVKDVINCEKYKLFFVFGDCFFDDENYFVLFFIWEIDGELCFKVIGEVDGKLFMGVFIW